MAVATPPLNYAYTDTPYFGNPQFGPESEDLMRVLLRCTRCNGTVIWANFADHDAWHVKINAFTQLRVIAMPILALGATVDRTVTWKVPFDSASYTLDYDYDAALIGKVTPTVKVGTQTATGVTITLRAALAVTLIGNVYVLATGPKQS